LFIDWYWGRYGYDTGVMGELNNHVIIQIFIKLSVEPHSRKNEIEVFDESSTFVAAKYSITLAAN
jgi:hypothetical protein